MSNQVFRLTWCRLNGYEFRLIWNGFAMTRWDLEQIDDTRLGTDTRTLAQALEILGSAAAAVLRHCGYPADDVPGAATLQAHFDCLAAPWEREAAINAIAQAIQCGCNRQYPDETESDSIDTIELKKN